MGIWAAGQPVEAIDNYTRTHEIRHSLFAKESRETDSAEAFGHIFDPQVWKTGSLSAANYSAIDANSSLQVLFKPLSGLLSQSKMPHVRCCPITIQLELVGSFEEPFLTSLLLSSQIQCLP